MPEETPCQIKCNACGQWADSRVQFTKADAFFNSALIGKTVICTWCGEETVCSIENMRFYERKNGVCIGTFVEGKNATPRKK